MSGSFTYVLIPADADDAMSEITMDAPQQLEANIGCLTSALQAYFREHAGPITSAGRQSMLESLQKQLKGGQSVEQQEKMLGQLELSQTVDIIQLLPTTGASGWIGVNMYVDDRGVAKGAAVNRRASELCTQVGLMVEVLGDAFIAKVWDDQDGFERLDLHLSDLASDAAWVVEARTRNANRPDLQSAAAKLKGMTPQKPSEPDLPFSERLEKARDLRSKGTAAYKEGEFAEAAAAYESAISIFSPPPPPPEGSDLEAQKTEAREIELACLLNLAACRLKQQRPYDAISACDRALEIDDGAAKAWYRRGQACMALQQFGAARKNLTRAGTLCPSSREIRTELERCKQLAAERATA